MTSPPRMKIWTSGKLRQAESRGNRGRLLGRFAARENSAKGRGSAAAGARHVGIEVGVQRLGGRFGGRPNQEWNMESMAERGRNDLRKRGTSGTPRPGGEAHITRQSGAAVGLEGVAKFVHHGALLSGEQQQQQPECFEEPWHTR